MATKRKSKKSKRKYNLIATVAFVVIILIVAVVYYFVVPKNAPNNETNNPSQTVYGDLKGDLKVHFVDVDQGDGIIIQLPNGQNMLVDAGDNKTASINKLTNYIDSLGITTFDYLIATHSDSDHIGGMPTIFERYQINYVYRPYMYSSHAQAVNFPEGFNQGSTRSSYSCSTQIYYRFLQCIIDEGSGWSFFNKDSDISFEFKDENEVNYTCTFDFLTPTADISDISYKSNMNNYSPIIKVSYCDYDILLTGDAEKEAEQELLEYYTDLNYLDVELLKVGHHGSDTSSTTAFLSAVKPEVSVISCGVGNTYHHPIESTLNGLVTVGSAIYRTDVQGSIVLTVDEHGAHNIVTTKTDYNEADLYVPGV